MLLLGYSKTHINSLTAISSVISTLQSISGMLCGKHLQLATPFEKHTAPENRVVERMG